MRPVSFMNETLSLMRETLSFMRETRVSHARDFAFLREHSLSRARHRSTAAEIIPTQTQ